MKIQFSLSDSLLPVFKKGFVELGVSYKRLSLRMMLQDFMSVAWSVGFVALPAFVIGLIFLLLPQGRDTLVVVIENMTDYNFYSLIFLLAGVFFWGIASELSVRYSIYISDNSGKNLSDARVMFRKTSQKLLAAAFLLWPYFMVMAGFAWNWMILGSDSTIPQHISFAACIVLIYLLMVLVSNLYFQKHANATAGVRLKKTLFGARSLPDREYRWLQKLYGIYNDHVYSLPKVSSYKGKYKEAYSEFTDYFTGKSNTAFREGLPQNPEVMAKLRLLPKDFEPIDKDKIIPADGELYKWTYCIPTNFYAMLHYKIKRLALVSIGLLVLIALIPVKWNIFGYIGAPALIVTAFACYSGLYCGLLFLDKGFLRTWKISIRFLVLVLFICSSIFNNDHPVRMDESLPNAKRDNSCTAFHNWFAEYKQKVHTSNPGVAIDKYPVIFVCAEGGAFRTGAYTSLYLTKLEDTLSKTNKADFRNSVFAMSGVSGGAVGLGFYNAVAYRDPTIDKAKNVEKAKGFFGFDALSPIVAKMFYGDFLNLFIPVNIQLFDRATALEETWEMAYEKHAKSKQNIFEGDYVSDKTDPSDPMLVINTTEIETGLQCWVSTMEPNSLLFKDQRDLLDNKVNRIKYSTAVNFSTRFPLFSPAAKIGGKDGDAKLHYLDGGYVENTGSGSMLELLKQLEQSNPEDFKQVTPIVICLLFSDNAAEPEKNIRTFNELSEVVSGIYNTRAGRSKTAFTELQMFVDSHNGVNISEPLRQSDIPMNWVLSGESMDKIEKDIADKLNDTTPAGVLVKMSRSDLKFIKGK
jgi:Patatin-like phospholipase